MRKVMYIVLAIFVSTLSAQGWGLENLIGSKKETTTTSVNSGAELSTPSLSPATLKEQMNRSVLDIGLARQQLLQAQLYLTAALGKKQEAAKIMSANGVIKDGGIVAPVNRKELGGSIKTSNELNKLVENISKEDVVNLTDEQKVLFKKSIPHMLGGLTAEAGQIAVIVVLGVNINQSLKDADWSAAPKLAAMAIPAAKLATLIPGDIKAMYQTYTLMRMIGENNDIQVAVLDRDELLKGPQ